MIMSKYANLSDIDDQPDVYETTDDIEQTQHYTYDNDDDQSSNDGDTENLNRTRISLREASERFKNSVVDSNNTDFSDQLTRRKKTMYRTYVRRPIETNEYEILPKELVLQETQLQKYRRLTFEVQELSDALDNDKDNEKPKDDDQDISQSDLTSQITYLQNELARLHHRILNTDQQSLDHGGSTTSLTTTYGKRVDEARSLIRQLEAYKALASPPPSDIANSSSAAEVKDANGSVVTYELFYTPETDNAQQQGNLVDVDERIARMEKLMGTSSGQGFDSIPTNLTNTSLLHSLSKLEQQITLLAQPRHLDTVARRLKVLNSELDRLHELKSGGPGGGRKEFNGYGLSRLHGPTPPALGTTGIDAGNGENTKEYDPHGLSNDTEEKVTHLFATMEKVDPLLNLTPALLTRLKALQGLHTEATTFGQSVKVISEEQTRMTEEIKSLDTTCELLTKSLKDNEDLVTKNVGVIDTRMADLVRRMEALASS